MHKLLFQEETEIRVTEACGNHCSEENYNKMDMTGSESHKRFCLRNFPWGDSHKKGYRDDYD